MGRATSPYAGRYIMDLNKFLLSFLLFVISFIVVIVACAYQVIHNGGFWYTVISFVSACMSGYSFADIIISIRHIIGEYV